jgi:hypothetical protein
MRIESTLRVIHRKAAKQGIPNGKARKSLVKQYDYAGDNPIEILTLE